MKYVALTMALALAGGILAGCDRDLASHEKTTVKDDGTVVHDQQKTTQHPDGTVTKEEKHEVNKP